MRRLGIITILLFAATLFISGCVDKDVTDGYYLVTRVIDGDTIEITGGGRVRYIGIDTPEVRRKINDEWICDPEPFALEAKKYNETLVLGNKVRLEFDVEKRDKYGRLLAYVYTDNGFMANEEILKEGLGRILTIYPNVRYSERFKKVQLEARKKVKGVWKQ